MFAFEMKQDRSTVPGLTDMKRCAICPINNTR